MSPARASRLQIFLNADESWNGEALYQAIVKKARALGLAGASVFPVALSYGGAHHHFHDAESEYSSFEIPVVVEVIDTPERLEFLILELGTMMDGGLAVVNPVWVVRWSGVSGTKRVEPSNGSGDPPPPRQRTSMARGMTSMRIEGEAQRVTIYIGQSDTWHGHNLAIAIVERCRELGIAGATASRGVMGFGARSVIHRPHFLGLSEDLPEKIEIIDRSEKIAHLLPVIEEMVGGGLISVEDVRVVRNLHESKDA